MSLIDRNIHFLLGYSPCIYEVIETACIVDMVIEYFNPQTFQSMSNESRQLLLEENNYTYFMNI